MCLNAIIIEDSERKGAGATQYISPKKSVCWLFFFQSRLLFKLFFFIFKIYYLVENFLWICVGRKMEYTIVHKNTVLLKDIFCVMSASEHKLAFITSYSTLLNKNELIQPAYLKTHKVIYIKKSDLIRNMGN